MNHLDSRLVIKSVTETGSFAGYGNVYNVIDDGGDIVAPGCFAESIDSLKAKGQMPALLWQHRSGEPIGAYQTVREDSNGLYVEGKLALKTSRGAEAYELLKMDALSGLSIGFETKESSVDQRTGVRTITKGDLWEVSLVTFPMNDQARVAIVKAINEIKSVRDAERYLRDAWGATRGEAKSFLSVCLDLPRDAAEETQEIDALKAAFTSRFVTT